MKTFVCAKKTQFNILLPVLLAAVSVIPKANAGCGNITPSFTYTLNKTCGLPVQAKIANTSTGTSQNVANYVWKVGNKIIATHTGKKSLLYVFTTPGTFKVTVIATDTSKTLCRDSSSQTITISAATPPIKNSVGSFVYDPIWENCITSPFSPDSFGMTVAPNDTLKNYKIIWGDGSTDATGSQLLKTQSIYHKYSTLGQFNIKIISKVGSCIDTLQGLVVNERQPVASLQGPPTGKNYGCVPYTVRFVNMSPIASPNTKFNWDMGDGNTYSLPSTTNNDTLYHLYKKYTCNGTVSLTATNACGSSIATWTPIQMGDKDTAIIAPQNPNNCDLATPFKFDNTSQNRYCVTPNPRKYNWIWGDGTSSGWSTSNASQTKSFTARGIYKIQLIDSNSCGMDTAEYLLKIDSLPRVNAVANPYSGCMPLMVHFKDLSSGMFNTRTWNLADSPDTSGNWSSDSLPVHTYKASGTFKAVLALANKCGVVKDTVSIRVNQKAKASFSPIAGGCYPYTATFSNTTTEWFSSGTTYKWIFPDGTTSTLKNPASKVYTSTGNYTVRLISMDSCGNDTATQTFKVYGKPPMTISLVSPIACQKNAIDFSHKTSYSGNTVTWDHGDGTSFGSYTGDTVIAHSHMYDSAKSYTSKVYISDVNGCKDTQTYNVVIKANPTPAFTLNKTDGCGPLTITTTNTSVHNGGGVFSSLKFNWNYGQGSKSKAKDSTIKYAASKTRDSIYTLKLVVTNSFNCKDSISKTVTVYPKPLSKFTLSSTDGCGPLSISTLNASKPYDTGSIAIMKFAWKFGNVNSSKRDTSIVFPASKTKDSLYTVRLIANSEHNCIDTSSQTVRVYPKPKAVFAMSSNSGCRPLNVGFSNTSTPYDTGSINIMTFNWNFGNGTTSTLKTPAVTYNAISKNDTVFSIRLIASSEHGCKDTAYNNATLRPAPVANFITDKVSGCSPLAVTFSNKTLNGNSNKWFVNGVLASTATNPVLTFKGKYFFDSVITVALTSSSAFGCFGDTFKKTITVLGRPMAQYRVDQDTSCFPDATQFFNQSLSGYSYVWNFGNGTTSTQINPKLLFTKSKSPFKDSTYNISLTTKGANTCVDTFKGKVNILPYPIPQFTASIKEGCSPLTVSFKNTSINAKSVFWVFGDGYKSTMSNPVHTFDNNGLSDSIYTVMLYSYSLDCVDTVSMKIKVNRKPYAFNQADQAKACETSVSFKSLAQRAVSVKYNFGDGTSSTLPVVSHSYTPSPYQDTNYQVTMIAWSSAGCTDTFVRTIVIPQKLSVDFKDSAMVLCPVAYVKFENRSKGAIAYLWDFGDNIGSTTKNPVHEFSKPGTYRYKLIAFDANGCVDSLTSINTIKVEQRPKAKFDYKPVNYRMPTSNLGTFTDKSESALPITYSWDFDDMTGFPATSTAQHPTHLFSDSGYFNVNLIVDNGACKDTALANIRVEPPYPVPNFNVDKVEGCSPLSVTFNNSSKYSDSFTWYFGDGQRSAQKHPTHVYKQPGVYTVRLVAYGPGGEEMLEKIDLINVISTPFTFFNYAPDNTFLPNAIISTRNLSTGAVGYKWEFIRAATGEVVFSSTDLEPHYTLTDTGYYHIRLVSTNSYGCPDTMEVKNAVLANPKGLLHIPDAFTPNKDGLNEVFMPSLFNVKPDLYVFRIFNRWGEKVFETNNPNQGWDGFYKGQECQEGVYSYKLQAAFFNGEEINQGGICTLLR